jgi:hypothetical protein
MAKGFRKVYQFKITLRGIRPPIWRRILVPGNYTFWDLHVAIQDAMAWSDVHLHAFEVANPITGFAEEIGIPDEDFGGANQRTIAGWKRKIAQYFNEENTKARYVYDFGDDWVHTVKLEKILPSDKDVNYPQCLAGKRACPPEDCGGIWGYEDLLEIISDPEHEQYEETVEWLGDEDFDPDYFDRTEVQFDDPEERLKYALEDEGDLSEDELEELEDLLASASLSEDEKKANKEMRSLSRDLMHRIWKKAKAEDLTDLSPEERRVAGIMREHEDEFYNQFEFSDLTSDHEYEPETEVNPFLHIFIHSIVETQLEEKNPIEVVQFYKAMQKKGCSRHDTIHLIGAILAPVMFSVLKDKDPFDLDTYKTLLRKYKSKAPEEIMDLLVSEDQ